MSEITLADQIVHFDTAVERHRAGMKSLKEIQMWLRMNSDVKSIEALHSRLDSEIYVAESEFMSSHVRLQRKLTEVEL